MSAGETRCDPGWNVKEKVQEVFDSCAFFVRYRGG